MKFPETIQYMRDGGCITLHRLFFMAFKSKTYRLWDGMGPVTTPLTGEKWEGIGRVVRVEGGGQASGLFSSNMKLTVGVDKNDRTDAIMMALLDSQREIYGRRFFSAIQIFNADLKPLDRYTPDFVGAMDRMIYRATATSTEVTLNIEPPLIRKNNPRVRYFSDRELKRYAPDDDFMSRISRLANKTIKWPTT